MWNEEEIYSALSCPVYRMKKVKRRQVYHCSVIQRFFCFFYLFICLFIRVLAYLVQRQCWPQGMVRWHKLMLYVQTEIVLLPQGLGPALSTSALVLYSSTRADDTEIKAGAQLLIQQYCNRLEKCTQLSPTNVQTDIAQCLSVRWHSVYACRLNSDLSVLTFLTN